MTVNLKLLPPAPERVSVAIRADAQVAFFDGHTITYKDGRRQNWLDYLDYGSGSSTNSLFKSSRLHIHFGSFHLTHIQTYLFHFGLDMDPPYQRGLVWGEEQEQAFLDSCFDESMELGRFIVAKNEWSDDPGFLSAEVVDGKQRISTLRKFWLCEIPHKTSGLYFLDLSRADKRSLENRRVSIAELSEDATLQEKVAIFSKVNRAGVPMDRKFLEEIERKFL